MYVARFLNSSNDMLKQSSKRTGELKSMKTSLTHVLNCFLDVCEFETSDIPTVLADYALLSPSLLLSLSLDESTSLSSYIAYECQVLFY